MESEVAAPYSHQMPEWLVFLRLLCAFADGSVDLVVWDSDSNAAAACVSTVLNDSPQRRIAVLGARAGMPWSLGSVYGGAVTRFLGGFRGGVTRIITTNSRCNSVAVSVDGSVLLVTCDEFEPLLVFSVHTGKFLRTIGGPGDGPLQFSYSCQVWVASDGFVFVAEFRNNRIQILTPHFDFYAFVGVGQLVGPAGVCANENNIIATEFRDHRIVVLDRHTGTLLRRFGVAGSGNGELRYPGALCFLPGRRHIAVAEFANSRVSVFNFDGEFVSHVGVGKLQRPTSVACSDANELVVADNHNDCVIMFNASREVVWTSREVLTTSESNSFTCIAMRGSSIFALTDLDTGVVFS